MRPDNDLRNDDLPDRGRPNNGSLQTLLTVAMLAVAIGALVVAFHLYNDPWLR